ncbi:MAG TPA: S-layer homology domain-containing protein [bacterium]|nr:S-layer homology domain-containing protein [bacterium]HOY43304.1 S-layer homology domain-containing protein [bacterium]
MKARLLFYRGAALLLLLLAAGCGPKAIKEASVQDTPEKHFGRGMYELERGNMTSARTEFERAIALNPDYGEAFSGLALISATEGDYKKAHELADKALDKNGKSLESLVVKGRIFAMERKGDDWVEKAAKQFDKALAINPSSAKALFYKGEAYKEGYQFGEAAGLYSKVIALKGDYAAQADQAWERMQKIQRAAPGSKEGARIALIDEIDRADVAVLFMDELKLMEILKQKRAPEYNTGFKAPEDPTAIQTSVTSRSAEVTDIDNHWAKSWISEIIAARGMELFPDRTFRPDEKITRVDYAMLLQNILIMATGDESLATRYIGQPSRFPDVNPTHYAYNAVCLMVDRGIMKADKMTGAFDLKSHVSGADALLIIRDFQNAMRLAF